MQYFIPIRVAEIKKNTSCTTVQLKNSSGMDEILMFIVKVTQENILSVFRYIFDLFWLKTSLLTFLKQRK